MRHGRQEIFLTLALAFLPFLAPAAVLGQDSGALDLGSLLSSRDPAVMIGGLKEEMQDAVEDRWVELLTEDSQLAEERNLGDLYPNPSIQAYVNRLGQQLIPKEVSGDVLVSFRVVEDPLPYADALATGTVYLSTGMISLLDNESQLAFLLMHEAGHVILSHNFQQAIEDVKEEKRDDKIKMVGSAAGALSSFLVGKKGGEAAKALIGAALGYKASKYGAKIAGAIQHRLFLKEIQLESDRFATHVLLQSGYDVREAPALMAKVGDIVRRSGAAVDLAFGNAGDLPDRSAKITEVLNGPYQSVVARILQGEGFRMSSPLYSQLIADVKRDNGLLALKKDLFVIAQTNLEEAAAVRTDDPLTMYGLGVLYRMVGRTDEDIARAATYLKSAMEFDEVRRRFPEAYLQYAVELLSREDPQRYPEVQKALKTYVVLYQRNSGGKLPREMRFIYDCLDLTGDRAWIAYEVDNVSSEAPYQLMGDAKIDGSSQPAEKRPTKK